MVETENKDLVNNITYNDKTIHMYVINYGSYNNLLDQY